MSGHFVLRQVLLGLLILSHCSATLYRAQTKTPPPPKPPESDAVQDSLKVFIEEVRIPITAQDEYGGFDPTVSINDLMLRENGDLQQLKSVYRIPANVLLLLDTGGEQNLAKNVRLTRSTAESLVSSLQTHDQIAVIQVNNQVELLHDWTTSRVEIMKRLDNKLLPGKRVALVKGLNAAVKQFKPIPSGNNHLVLVSDGIERSGIQPDLDEAFKNVIAANITVHVLSYTSLGSKVKRRSPSRPREKSAVDKHLIAALPSSRLPGDSTPDLKTIMESKGGVVVDLDHLFKRNGIKDALAQREKEFIEITAETGGSVALPASANELIAQAGEVARRIDSQYVISYKPTRPMNSATENEYRKIDVIPRRVGLSIIVRRGYVARIQK